MDVDTWSAILFATIAATLVQMAAYLVFLTHGIIERFLAWTIKASSLAAFGVAVMLVETALRR